MSGFLVPRNACMVKPTADITGQNLTGGAAIPFDNAVYDDGGWHDNVTNNSRLTVPAGVTRVCVGASIMLANDAAGAGTSVVILKNGVGSFNGAAGNTGPVNSSATRFSTHTGPVPVAPGNYFQVQVIVATDTSVDIVASNSNFWIEAR